MNKKIRWITETAVMLALLVALQALTKPFSQLVTGSCVNAILAVAVLVGGPGCGITVAILSPLLAFTLGIAPNFITVVPIMLGNTVYVLILWMLLGRKMKPLWKRPVALVLAAVAKFGVLYLLVVKIICGVAANVLLGQKLGETVLLAPPMLKKLPAMFTWPQLFTALLGGFAALLMVPVLRKALRK
ncbi:MAG: ECF transporter S component [Oscillospiraceae bacterium]|nr:ECF transporter S component [Oscillospiraceae bacterium]